MTKFGKNIFGKGFDVKAEVTKGKCPLCESPTVFVSLHRSFYRCMNCGADLQQRINGVINYIPSIVSRKEGTLYIKEWVEDGKT